MIISHARRFIFLKTRKTAGTSIEITLSALCGPDDVITTISPKDEATRAGLGYPTARNYHVPFGRYTVRDWGRLVLKGTRQRFYNHNPASHVVGYIDAEIWREYFKFCFERNPWDKVVSSYYWEKVRAPHLEFSEFVISGKANKVEDFDLYSINGEIVVDHVYRYEALDESLADICSRLGGAERPVLPRSKGGARKSRGPYRVMYGDEEREKVARVFAREIAHFGYGFGTP